MSGALNTHLEEIDRSAEEMLDRLITEMAEKEGLTEALKSENQMEWVQQMNSIRRRAAEVIVNDLICK